MRYSTFTLPGGALVYQESSPNPLDPVRFYTESGEPLTEALEGLIILDSNAPVPTWGTPDPVPEIPTYTPPPPEPIHSVLSKLEFLNLFTQSELEGIYGAAQQNISMVVWINKFNLAEFLDVMDPQTQMAIRSFEAFGLIGEGRAQEILSRFGVA